MGRLWRGGEGLRAKDPRWDPPSPHVPRVLETGQRGGGKGWRVDMIGCGKGCLSS